MTLATRQRINVTLPNSTINLIRRVSTKGDRSQLIDTALKHYVQSVGQAILRRRLKDGAINRAKESLEIVADWFLLDEEVWAKQKK
ncbi:MAG: hypothetical protein V1704_02075 [Candidatus Vogelbacteria bacterium]